MHVSLRWLTVAAAAFLLVAPLGAQRSPVAVTIVSAISPPGGDFSEPVTQAALRGTGALCALDAWR